MFSIINSLVQSIHASRANIDITALPFCSILPYSISTLKLDGSA
jgi:hypothetical protein